MTHTDLCSFPLRLDPCFLSFKCCSRVLFREFSFEKESQGLRRRWSSARSLMRLPAPAPTRRQLNSARESAHSCHSDSAALIHRFRRSRAVLFLLSRLSSCLTSAPLTVRAHSLSTNLAICLGHPAPHLSKETAKDSVSTFYSRTAYLRSLLARLPPDHVPRSTSEAP